MLIDEIINPVITEDTNKNFENFFKNKKDIHGVILKANDRVHFAVDSDLKYGFVAGFDNKSNTVIVKTFDDTIKSYYFPSNKLLKEIK